MIHIDTTTLPSGALAQIVKAAQLETSIDIRDLLFQHLRDWQQEHGYVCRQDNGRVYWERKQ